MKITKEDLINKFESLSGYLRYENERKWDKTFYNDLCDEVEDFCKELRESEVEFEQEEIHKAPAKIEEIPQFKGTMEQLDRLNNATGCTLPKPHSHLVAGKEFDCER